MQSEKEAYLSTLGADASGNTSVPRKVIKKKPVTMAALIKAILFGKKEDRPKIRSKERDEEELLESEEPDVMP